MKHILLFLAAASLAIAQSFPVKTNASGAVTEPANLLVSGAFGGTGVNNSGKTLTLGGNFSTSGAFGLVLTLTGNTTVTLPTSGTLSTLAGAEVFTNKSIDLANNTLTATSAQIATAVTDETGTGALVFANSPTFVTPTLGAAAGTSLTLSGALSANSGALTSLTVSGASSLNGTTIPTSKTLVVTTDKLSVLSATTSAELAGVISNETGTGNVVFSTSPTLVTPNLGTPSAAVLTNATGLPLTTGVTGVLPGANGGTGVANTGKTITLGGNLTTSGAFDTTLTMTGATTVTLPTAGTLATLAGSETFTNKSIDAGQLTGTVVAARMPAFTGDISTSAGATATTLATVNSNTGAFGSATKVGTFTVNGKGLVTAAADVTITPAVGSITGLAEGVATFLATPSSANLLAAVTDETGTGALVFANSPTLVTPVLGAATGTSLSLTGDLQLGNTYTLTWGGAYGAGIPSIAGSTGAGNIQIYPTGSTSGATAVFTASTTTIAGNLTVSGTGTSTFAGPVAITSSGTSLIQLNLPFTSRIIIGEGATNNANPAITLYRTTGGNAQGTAIRFYQPDSAGNFYIQKGTTDAVYGTETYTTNLAISSAGNLLVGTTTDGGQKLQVSGTAAISSNLTVGGVQNVIGSASPSANFPLRINQGATDAAVTMDIANVSSGTSAAANFQLQSDAGTSFIRQHSIAHAVWPNYLLLGGSDKIAISTDSTANGIELMTGYTTRLNITTATTTVSNNLTTTGRILTTTVKTANYTVATTDHVVVCNSATAFTVTMLGATTNSGRHFIVKNKGAGTVTVDATSLGQIDGVNTITLEQYQSATLVSDGTTWNRI